VLSVRKGRFAEKKCPSCSGRAKGGYDVHQLEAGPLCAPPRERQHTKK